MIILCTHTHTHKQPLVHPLWNAEHFAPSLPQVKILWGENDTISWWDSNCLACIVSLSRHYTECHLLWVIGGKKCLLWFSEIISGCRGLICWGWALLWDDETSEQKNSEVLAQVLWCREEMGIYHLLLCSQCRCKIPLKTSTELTSLLHMYSQVFYNPNRVNSLSPKWDFALLPFSVR